MSSPQTTISIIRSKILDTPAVSVLTLRQSAMSMMLVTLVLCCLGAFVAVVLGVLFRRSLLWRLTAALVACALALFVAIALLDRLGFGGRLP